MTLVLRRLSRGFGPHDRGEDFMYIEQAHTGTQGVGEECLSSEVYPAKNSLTSMSRLLLLNLVVV